LPRLMSGMKNVHTTGLGVKLLMQNNLT